jgi:hypothetical protein
MNNYDRENLQFLLNADSATLKEWYESVTPDDIEYAAELMLQYGEELSIRTGMLNDDVEDVSQASDFLKRFSLGKK